MRLEINVFIVIHTAERVLIKQMERFIIIIFTCIGHVIKHVIADETGRDKALGPQGGIEMKRIENNYRDKKKKYQQPVQQVPFIWRGCHIA